MLSESDSASSWAQLLLCQIILEPILAPIPTNSDLPKEIKIPTNSLDKLTASWPFCHFLYLFLSLTLLAQFSSFIRPTFTRYLCSNSKAGRPGPSDILVGLLRSWRPPALHQPSAARQDCTLKLFRFHPLQVFPHIGGSNFYNTSPPNILIFFEQIIQRSL